MSENESWICNVSPFSSKKQLRWFHIAVFVILILVPLTSPSLSWGINRFKDEKTREKVHYGMYFILVAIALGGLVFHGSKLLNGC